MALDFTGSDSDNVNHGTLGSYAMDDFTVLIWLKSDSFINGTFAWTKQSSEPDCQLNFGTAGDIEFWRHASPAHYATVTAPMSTGVWYYVAITFDVSDGPRIFIGSLTAKAVEQSYSARQVGGSTLHSVTSSNFIAGNWTGTLSPDGQLAFVAIYDNRFTLADVVSHQFNLHTPINANCKLFTNYGLAGDASSTQPDWSGNGNNGTVTGATIAPHVPLPVFPFQTRMPYAVSAAVGRTTKNTDPYGLGIAPGISRTFKIGGL